MVPIHDTDVAHERWSKAEWENYELWEKVEQRLKRQKRLWVFGTLALFLALSAVPIALDRWPKWVTRSAARLLAQEINRLKREASLDRAALRLRFVREGDLNYVVERIPNCSMEKGEIVRTASLTPYPSGQSFSWISTEKGNRMGIPGLVSDFCYDHLAGSGAVSKGESVVGFGIVPTQDFAEGRIDRLSILLLSGPSAEATFD